MSLTDRKGLELAAGTIIILIVSVIILVLASTVTYRAFCAAEEYANDVDSRTSQRIDQLMTTGGGKVVVGDNTKDASWDGAVFCGGSRTRSAEFALGIRAPLTGSEDFEITIEKTNVPDGTTSELVPNEVQMFGLTLTPTNAQGTITIPLGTRDVRTILFTLPAGLPSGQYTYTITVRQSGEVYGAQQVYINAE